LGDGGNVGTVRTWELRRDETLTPSSADIRVSQCDGAIGSLIGAGFDIVLMT